MTALKRFLVVLSLLLCIRVQGQLFLFGGRGTVPLTLYKADRVTMIASLTNTMEIDIAKTPRVNIQAFTRNRWQSLQVSSMSFYVNDELAGTDNDAPFWMINELSNGWAPRVGWYVIRVECYRRNGGKGIPLFLTSIFVRVIDTGLSTPVPAAPIRAPTAAPIAAPVADPMVAVPAMSPAVAAPATAPVVAASAPAVAAPVTAPLVAAPMSSPITTRIPTRQPTKTPAAPCTRSIVDYINNVTFSKQILTLAGTTPLDRALSYLITANGSAALSPCDQFQLSQCFAYAALMFTTGMGNATTWFNNTIEPNWRGFRFKTTSLPVMCPLEYRNGQ
jgi:hypothetical protein